MQYCPSEQEEIETGLSTLWEEATTALRNKYYSRSDRVTEEHLEERAERKRNVDNGLQNAGGSTIQS